MNYVLVIFAWLNLVLYVDLHHVLHIVSEDHPTHNPTDNEGSFPWGEAAPVCKADYSLPGSAEEKNMRI